MTQAYPLHWPPGFPRTGSKAHSQFRTELPAAVNKLTRAVSLFSADSDKKIENFIVSSNASLMDSNPADGGVACYFRWDGIDCCIAVDRYERVKDNLMAVVHIIEAERTKLRHGGLNIIRATFRGFAALPPPRGADGQLAKPWWQTLGFKREPGELVAVEQRYKELVKTHHPDRGGDAAEFNVITEAVRQAREALG